MPPHNSARNADGPHRLAAGEMNPIPFCRQDSENIGISIFLGQHRASYEVTACTVKFLGRCKGNEGAPMQESPPDGYEEEELVF